MPACGNKDADIVCVDIRRNLSPDLLRGQWVKENAHSGNPLEGHCYVAAEAAFHLLGGKASGLRAMLLTNSSWPDGLDQGQTHWFLEEVATGVIIDPTAGQFDQLVRYDLARPCGFLTKVPSRRAQTLIGRVLAGRKQAVAA